MSASSVVPPRSSARRIFLRGVVPVLVGLVVGALAGLGYAAVAHKRYTATTRVFVTATGVDSSATTTGRTNTTINLDTEAQLVTSSAVVQRAVKAYPPLTKQTAPELVKDVTVTVPANTQVLQISFENDSATSAEFGADAFAKAYLDDRQSNAQSLLTRQKQNAQQSATSLEGKLQSVSNQIAALQPGAPNRQYLSSLSQLYKAEITGYDEQFVTLGTVQITPGRVVTPANRPTSPSSPSRTISVGSGAGAGLIIGLIVAWVLVRFRRTVRRPEDVETMVDVACLVALPRLDQGGPALYEQFRRLALVAASAAPGAQRLVFATPLPSDSGGLVAAGVASALVRSGTTTALLRINPRPGNGPRPRGVKLASLPNSDAVSSEPGESLLGGLDRLRGDNDVIVIEAAAGAIVSADAQAVATVADAVVLVVDVGTSSKVVRAAVDAFDSVGAPMLGIVLVRPGRGSGSAGARQFGEEPGPATATPAGRSGETRGGAPANQSSPGRPVLEPPETPPTRAQSRGRQTRPDDRAADSSGDGADAPARGTAPRGAKGGAASRQRRAPAKSVGTAGAKPSDPAAGRTAQPTDPTDERDTPASRTH